MKKKLLSDSFIYGLPGIIGKLISVITLPIYSNVLSKADFGFLGFYNSSFYLLLVIFQFGLDNASMRFFFDENNKNKKAVIMNWILFQFIITLIFGLLFYIFNGLFIDKLYSLYQFNVNFFIVYFLVLISYILPSIIEVYFRIQQKAIHAFTFAIVLTIINVSSTYYFIVLESKGYMGFIYGQLLSYSICSLLSILLLYKRISFQQFNFGLLKKMLKYSAPIVPSTFMSIGISWLANYAIIISNYGIEETGIYQMANTLAAVINLITSAFLQAYIPFSFSIMTKENSKTEYSKILNIYILLMCFVILGYSIFSYDILAIFINKKFKESSVVIIFIVYYYFIASLPTIINIGNTIKMNTTAYTKSMTVYTLITSVLFFVLIPKLGAVGASISMIVGQVFNLMITYYYSQKNYPIQYNILKNFIVILFSVLLSIVFYFLFKDLTFSYYMFFVKIIGYVIIGIFILYLNKKTIKGI
ncbi:O-antigen/teichoic acid export membrane protein [Flavobacterium croceum DSM 17960]|uniref:O-antigen/teichoic acid export membrane protein n=1 Tax=Flavobacterium croceum DSM 17960 TaxID=1121886 RepID=A0A2S4N9J7_9FLAO|nr:oligosaccharide flippase family protein [Flavobacterium croceum]POS02364.1 O-antigen/teichoic acid export membrane protein [Flavobacterium croceum DSM 17960]